MLPNDALLVLLGGLSEGFLHDRGYVQEVDGVGATNHRDGVLGPEERLVQWREGSREVDGLLATKVA